MSSLTAERPLREPGRTARDLVAGLPLLIVAIMLLASATNILPSSSLIGVGVVQLNLERILILIGLVAVFWTEGLRRELVRTGIGLPLILLLAVALLSSHKFGTYPRYRFLVEGVALFYLTFAVVRVRPEAREALAVVGLIALAIVAMTAVTQVAQGQVTGFYRHGCTPVTKPFGKPPSGSITRAIGTFANPNILAGYLLLLLPLGALASRLAGRVRGLWPALVATLGLGYLAVVFTYSRAAVLLSIAVIGVGILLSRLTHRRYLLLVALGLAIALGFLLSSCGSDATAGYGRGTEWRQTLEVIRDNPVYGVGLGRLGAVLHHRNALSTAQHAHNLWLTWWAEAGTGALIAWLWIAIGLLWRSLRSARTGDLTAGAAFLSLLGFFGYSMVDHPANVDQVALALWIVAGIAAATSVSPHARRARWRGGFLAAALGVSGEEDSDHALTHRARTGNVRVVAGAPPPQEPRPGPDAAGRGRRPWNRATNQGSASRRFEPRRPPRPDPAVTRGRPRPAEPQPEERPPRGVGDRVMRWEDQPGRLDFDDEPRRSSDDDTERFDF